MVRATLSLAIVATTAAVVSARPTYVARLPNGDNVSGVAALGHVDPAGGGANNDFGLDFGTAGDEWTTEFCQKDSDGDGQTNGQELGDPCCVWTVGGTPQWTSGVSHPGDSSSTSDESLWADITCSGDSNSTSTSTSSTAGSNASTVEAGSTTTTETTDAATPASASSSSAAASSGSSAASVVTPAMCSAVSVAAAVAAFFM
ncbi:Calcium-activated potassium channel subunit alpha-1 [Phytophthora cinnamomi]|uniref:Calcium-activated potassium channel subunit alpha-1 n=1 Tax=Phytophthora cinnamomi TaxID=4785 RepID=UPI00355A97E9|nr:Calcium-activated potassium channel subunit alpha-1 [Phytophthora cinnamomi]